MEKQLTRYEALLACRDKAGSDSALARGLGLSQPTVWRWINQTKQMPAEYVLAAEAAFGISRYDLRPDIYPRTAPMVAAMQGVQFYGAGRRSAGHKANAS